MQRTFYFVLYGRELWTVRELFAVLGNPVRLNSPQATIRTFVGEQLHPSRNVPMNQICDRFRIK